MQVEWSSFFAQLVADYLKAGAGENELPTLAVLPVVATENTSTQKRPVVVVTCEPDDQDHPRVFQGTINVALLLRTSPDGEQPTDASEYMGAIDARLRDTVAWSAWAAGLSEERRTGWIVIDYRVAAGVPEAEPEEHAQTRRVHVRLKCKVERPVAEAD